MAKHLTPSTTPPAKRSLAQEAINAMESPSPAPADPGSYELVNMNRDLMRFADADTFTSRRSYPSLTRSGVAPSQPSAPDQRLIDDGVELLNQILDFVSEIGLFLLDLEPSGVDIGCIDVLGAVAWKSISKLLHRLLDDRSPAKLESASRAISEQTSLPLVFPPTAADGALDSMLSPENMRWEVVGMWAALVGIWLGGEKDRSLGFAVQKGWKSDRKTLMQTVFGACTRCESLCNRIGAVNDLMLWFVIQMLLFATWCYGDDSYHVFRLMGSLTSVFLALGYHKRVQEDHVTPLYLVEIRRRIISWAHDHDKVGACFTSRPPRLSHHFCAFDLPLDIPDSAITGPAEALREAAANLDEHGWNTQGEIYRGARLRVTLLFSPIFEEALELKNGHTTRSTPELVVKARDALERISLTWQSIPQQIRFAANHAQRLTDEDTPIVMTQALRLHYLFIEFILYTVLANAGESEHERVIATAHEVVSLVLLPTRQREAMDSRRSDIEWTLVFFAMPCASVLVLELLWQAQHPGELHIHNRSGIIQDISVLISCCESLTEQGQNNYAICKQAQTIFSKSLDSILNQNSAAGASLGNHLQQSVSSQQQQQLAFEGDAFSTQLSEDPIPDWTSWLESVGLQADPWLDSITWPADFPADPLP
ncbi:uncharacterized protein LTR77_010757 [Saxophila tyrrhenica]|uniref:Transcription factor domain-containing protein n=1 Tax=Saxophila tyrrhenica TaxID=1690608 RepID=A0AAV9NV63_9PEZI|nr:hypothetical protein LTR77_010757 [Saxophila tyrrhenica]